MIDGGEGGLKVEIIKMVLVASEEEYGGRIYSRTIISNSRECSQRLVRRDQYLVSFGK